MAITIRANEAQLKQLEQLKKYVQETTGSGALLEASKRYPKLYDDHQSALNEIKKLKDHIWTMKRGIRNYDEAKKELLALAED